MDKELSSVEVKEAKDTHIDTNPEGNEESAVTSVKEGDEDDLVLDSKSDHGNLTLKTLYKIMSCFIFNQIY